MRRMDFLSFVSFFLASASVFAAEPSPTPSSTPVGGKNVRAKMDEPHRGKAVGVKAADPTRNGQVNTSGALSPLNVNSMGVGVQFDLTKPKKVAPKKADKDAEESE